jgi:DNA-binding response OmpR family regulator
MKRVLLVNDDPVILDRTAAMLEEMGYEVYVATTAELARESSRSYPPDIAIVDVEMRNGVGFELIAELNRAETGILVVAVTRGDHKELWPKVAQICGATEYVVGPVSALKLKDAIAPDEDMLLH